MVSRLWRCAVVGLVLFGLVLQVVITVRAPGLPPAHAVGTLAGAPLVTRLVRVASFFTIQSNVLCALVSVQLARDPRRDGRVWRVLHLDALLGITITGIVYATVLARIHEPKGWEQTVSNAIFHYAVPLMTVVGCLAFGPRPRIDAATVARAAIWPVAWLVYTVVHGELSDWYPYPFVDVATHGYGPVFVNAVVVLVVCVVVSVGFLIGDRRLPARS